MYEDLSWSTAGFVYQRVFEGTPAHHSWYFESPLAGAQYRLIPVAAQPPTDFFLDTPDAKVSSRRHEIHVVPEPATMGLLGLGALVMAIRRRRS